MFSSTKTGGLTFRYGPETVAIEPWGQNALRVRATHEPTFHSENWALSQDPVVTKSEVQLPQSSTTGNDSNGGAIAASITNGKIKATFSHRGKLTVSNAVNGSVLLQEFSRHRLDLQDPKCSALNIQAREFKPILGTGQYHLTARFESLDPEERIYGMGQYQQPYLNLKGTDLELAQRNSQASIPFALSSLGFGFLWNNPGIGRAVFGKNVTSFEAYSTTSLDYWIVVGDTPAEIVSAYSRATGTVPMMPEYGLGFWQCKLRYQTQEELLEVAREYRRRKLPIDLIVIDFFHWPKQGEWKFDPTFWPDPDAMISELKSLNIELMVSVWPTVDRESENFEHMEREGLLVRQDRGVNISMEGQGNPIHFDPTNPASRAFVWDRAYHNYYKKGIRVFWLDEAEPEYTIYDFDVFRYHRGSNLSIGNIYPSDYARAFYEGMSAAKQSNIVNLARCAWSGSQRFGTLIWSGDIASSWTSMRDQVCAGLNIGLAGIPWWTTDIGGFHGGDPKDPAFRELFVRWFQWGAFCPVMRLHGDREPKQPRLGDSGGSFCLSGAPNEVWSYGDDIYHICRTYLFLREQLREYTRGLMKAAHESGDPVIRPCFYDFPHDKTCWQAEFEERQYMYGPKYLVAPILEPGTKTRRVYLPNGSAWKQLVIKSMKDVEDVGKEVLIGEEGKELLDGGKVVEVGCPIETIPVFVRQ